MGIWFGTGVEETCHLDGLFCNVFQVTDDILSLPGIALSRYICKRDRKLTLCRLETYPKLGKPSSYPLAGIG